MLRPPELDAAISKIRLIAARGPWWRIVAFRHLLRAPAQPLWAAGSKIDGARFAPKGGFDSLYLAADQITALAEVNGLVLLPAGPLSIPTPPCTLFVVNGVVSRVLDLTDSGILKALGTNEWEMTAPWVTVASPPTQVLAQAVYDSGLAAGILYGSAKHPGSRNLVVFPDRLRAAATDYLEVFDPHGNLAQRIGS
jgi:RES domain-containing protein